MSDIRKVAVLGSGVMGSGIAAQIANAGIEVLLLDIVPEGAAAHERSKLAQQALEKISRSKPAALMHADNARFISPGNLEDDLARLADCDWIIEVVLERLDVKQALYRKVQEYRKAGSVISSNTSTLPLKQLTGDMPEDFRRDFLITHFFNPPRYMRLLEVVSSRDTDHAQLQRIRGFADEQLGKNIVTCNDTPGFIANRIGTYWLHAAVSLAIKHNISVEAADAVLSRPAGVPKTGVFGLVDLVGVDLMPHLFASFEQSLPESDPFRQLGPMPALIRRMIDEGYTGRKGKGGFYRLSPAADKDGSKIKEAISLQDGSYHKAQRPKIKAAAAARKGGLQALLKHASPEGEYAWEVLSGTFCYAASLVPEIADTIERVDRAMRLGYNWKKGPFELMDEIGTDWFIEQLEARGLDVPRMLKLAEGRSFYRVKNGHLQFLNTEGSYQTVRRAQGVLLLEDIRRRSRPLFGNSQASVWDIGDGVACLEFHSKMNSLNPFIISVLAKALKRLPQLKMKGLVIYNEGSNFSVGANLLMLLVAAWLRLGPAIRWILKQGQFTFRDMKYAPFPVVGAPAGMALGGGCEVLLHCDAIEAHAESYIGLVEAGVGIVPGWGGCKEMLLRGKASPRLKKGPMPAVTHAFETIATAKVSTSAAEARDLLFLREGDGIVMNRDRLLAAAKARVLAMAEDYRPPPAKALKLPGPTAVAATGTALDSYVKQGLATAHDQVIARELATVLSGKDADMNDELPEERILELERDALVKLSKTAKTRARISHMLFKGKPLRN